MRPFARVLPGMRSSEGSVCDHCEEEVDRPLARLVCLTYPVGEGRARTPRAQLSPLNLSKVRVVVFLEGSHGQIGNAGPARDIPVPFRSLTDCLDFRAVQRLQ